MKILRNCVFNHYLDEYFEARKYSEDCQKHYEETVNVFVKTLNMSNVGSHSYWSLHPEEFWGQQKELADSTRQLKILRKSLASQAKEAKKNFKKSQHLLSIAQFNLDKAIKIQNGINSRNIYNLLDTDDIESIEKKNYYKLAALPIYSTEDMANTSGFNPTVLKQQQYLMQNGLVSTKC